jgi:CDP-paratose 2-epimerase
MSKRVLVPGGAGFIGSHVAEYYDRKGYQVAVLDNISRSKLMGKDDKNSMYNWYYLEKNTNVQMIKGDIRDKFQLEQIVKDFDIIIHTAAQTAVTTSVVDPEPDFTTNALGTFNILEAARTSKRKPSIIYCSTNKVYGENVNQIGVKEESIRYQFVDQWTNGIPETFNIDLCEHTPYGCSKLAGDLYMQDYARLYGLKIGVFRMSCIYGPRQFGVEDQGWVAWFTIATLLGKPITVYGDGKQVRDVLHVDDLIAAYDAFIQSDLRHGVYNMGGGPSNTFSLLELLDNLKELTGKKSELKYSSWRSSDQKVYISDITKALKELNWQPKVSPTEGVQKLVQWVQDHRHIM